MASRVLQANRHAHHVFTSDEAKMGVCELQVPCHPARLTHGATRRICTITLFTTHSHCGP